MNKKISGAVFVLAVTALSLLGSLFISEDSYADSPNIKNFSTLYCEKQEIVDSSNDVECYSKKKYIDANTSTNLVWDASEVSKNFNCYSINNMQAMCVNPGLNLNDYCTPPGSNIKLDEYKHKGTRLADIFRSTKKLEDVLNVGACFDNLNIAGGLPNEIWQAYKNGEARSSSTPGNLSLSERGAAKIALARKYCSGFPNLSGADNVDQRQIDAINKKFNGSARCTSSDNLEILDETAFENFINEKNEEEERERRDESAGEEDTCTSRLNDDGGGAYVSWVVCPGISLGTSVIDGLFKEIINDKLKIEFNSKDLSGLWANFLPVANLFLALMFIIAIYSTATGVGLSNYNARKMLQSLVMAAIGVNLSFFASDIMIDLSNIFGENIYSMIVSTGQTGSYEGVVGKLLTAVPQIVMIAIVLVLFLGIIILSGIIILLALTARELVLLVLVVISPLAFAMTILPNTKKWFDKWLNTFTSLLLVYPMFMGAWGFVIWLQINSGLFDSGMDWSSRLILCLALMALPVVPLLLILPMMKMSGGLMAKMTGQIQGFASKSPIGTWAKNRNEDEMRRFKSGRFFNRGFNAERNTNNTGKFARPRNWVNAQRNKMAGVLNRGGEALDGSVGLIGKKYGDKQRDRKIRNAAEEEMVQQEARLRVYNTYKDSDNPTLRRQAYATESKIRADEKSSDDSELLAMKIRYTNPITKNVSERDISKTDIADIAAGKDILAPNQVLVDTRTGLEINDTSTYVKDLINEGAEGQARFRTMLRNGSFDQSHTLDLMESVEHEKLDFDTRSAVGEFLASSKDPQISGAMAGGYIKGVGQKYDFWAEYNNYTENSKTLSASTYADYNKDTLGNIERAMKSGRLSGDAMNRIYKVHSAAMHNPETAMKFAGNKAFEAVQKELEKKGYQFRDAETEQLAKELVRKGRLQPSDAKGVYRDKKGKVVDDDRIEQLSQGVFERVRSRIRGK